MTEAREKNKVEKGVLYLVGTPIGNLADLSPRAEKVLSEADIIACEDTRVSGLLLSRMGIKPKQLISYHEHNKKEKGEEIEMLLSENKSVALITDAGMPGISDPGEDLVRLCKERHKISVIPGPTAVASALALSGLSTRRFFFEGFLPTQAKERKDRLDAIKDIPVTVVIYEAPHKLKSTLSDIYKYLGNRDISICRELTKLNEEIIYTTIENAIEKYEKEDPRGEYVLVIEGSGITKKEKESALLLSLTEEEHVGYYENQGEKRMDAIKHAAKDRGISKSELYGILEKKKGNI